MKIKWILLLTNLTLSGMIMLVNGQTPPNNDDNWVLNTTLSDEFNGLSIDNTKWEVWNFNGCCSARPFISSFASVSH